MDETNIDRLLDAGLHHDLQTSVVAVLNELDEHWMGGRNSSTFKDHFRHHVLQNNQKWTDHPSRPDDDGIYRIKMPRMSPEEYERRADALANAKDVGEHNDKAKPIIGGIAVYSAGLGKPYRETFVKIRRHSDQYVPGDQTVDGRGRSLNNFAEIVVYKKLEDGSNGIITYMLARNVIAALANIRFIDELPADETEKKNSVGYICIVNYTDDSTSERSFINYKDANDFFASNPEVSKLIKLVDGERKTMSEKNPKRVVPVEKDSYLTRVTESLLTEANRQQLLQKSRKARNYSPKNQYKGRNRYERRTKSAISATVRDYNMIQMDPLFKRDILEFKIPVMGETDVYVVDVRVDGLLSEIRKQLMANKGTLEFKVVLQSLMKVLNIGNVYIGCNCPDAQYRMAYQQTKNDYKAGYKERRPSNITNPDDALGAGCKHVLLVLANLDWAVKVASVINNYIKYCKEHLQRNYADYIFPKIYGMKYDKAVQLDMFDDGLFPEDKQTMKTVIDRGFRGKDEKGKFTKGNEFRFQKNEPEETSQEDENPLDLKFHNEDEPEEVSDEESSEIES